MSIANFIKEEFIVDFKKVLSYKLSFMTDLFIFAAVIISIFISGVDASYAESFNVDAFSGKMLVLIGFISWQVSTMALGWSSINIRSQSLSGTLELKMQSKYPLELMIFIEMLTYLIFSCISLTLIYTLFIFTEVNNVGDIKFVLLSYLIAFPGVIGMYGIGLILGGISLRQKEVGNLVFILQTLLFFLSDINSVRSGVFNLIPFNAGIKIIRYMYLGKPIEYSLPIIYILANLAWILIGIFVFRKLLDRERIDGSLHYLIIYKNAY